MKYQDLAIVILNWNGKSYLEQFLPSVIQYSAQARIIVADNASTDDSVSFVKRTYPNIEIVQNESNGGFAKGYNDALKKIQAPFYLLLNSDIEVSENWLEPLMKCMEDELVAGCQPKILAFHDKSKFEHAGASGGFLDHNFYPFCRGRILSLTEHDLGQYNGETEIFWSSGACMLLRSELFHEARGFDEDFFAHMEEIDLCWRIKRKGFAFKVVPSSKVYHVGGGTLAYLSPKKTYLNFRNSLYMICKNYEGFLPAKLFYRLCLDGIAASMFLLTGKPKHFWAVFKSHIDFYAKYATMSAKRKQIRSSENNMNYTGFYSGSILWARYFKKISRFSDLNMRLFRK